MDIVTYALAKKLVNGVQSGLASATVDNTNCSITFNWTNGTSSTLTFPKPADGAKGDKGDTGVSVQNVEIKKISGVRHLIVTLDDSTEIDAGILPNEQYDDTQVKADIAKLKSDKQDKTDNGLDTTDKTVIGAINEVNGNQLDTVGFSADYKNIILNRKNGLNPYIIPIASIIHNAKLVELGDVDSTDIGNGKTLVYDGTTKKHKYIDSAGTDELVKMEASTDAKYLSDLIDKSTIVNDNGTLKVKKLDGQEVTITEINYLKGLTMNVMDLVNMFANGGIKIINTPVSTHADLLAYDKKDLIDGISYLIYVLNDETHDGAKTTYLIDKNTATPTYFGYADSHRDFTTNPIDLANEVTGKLGTSNIDVDALWKLLTINDTYKTLTTNNEVFGTHGAKALYDELVASIGGKANTKDLTKHTGDTDIHITTAERTKWNEVDNKVNKTDIVDNLTSTDTNKPLSANQGKILDDKKINKTSIATTIDSTSTDTQVPSAKSVYDNAIKCNNIKTYYTLAQLGITSATCTIKDIWDKMPVNSIAIIDTNSSIVTDLDVLKPAMGITATNQFVYGFLTVGKFEERTILEFRRSHSESAITPETFIGYCIGKNCTAIDWKRIVITNVDNTSLKTLKNSSNINSDAVITYMVKNGMCNVSVNTVSSTKMETGNITLTTGLPIPVNTSCWYSICTNSNTTTAPLQNLLLRIDSSGNLIAYKGTNNVNYFGSFSYSVAES